MKELLTGKNRENFENWYKNNEVSVYYLVNGDGDRDVYKIDIQMFYDHPFEMQLGVLLSYYEEKCIDITTGRDGMLNWWCLEINNHTYTNNAYIFAIKAYKDAFIKANEILNEK